MAGKKKLIKKIESYKEPSPGTKIAGKVLDAVMSLTPFGAMLHIDRDRRRKKIANSKSKKLKLRRAKTNFKAKKVSTSKAGKKK